MSWPSQNKVHVKNHCVTALWRRLEAAREKGETGAERKYRALIHTPLYWDRSTPCDNPPPGYTGVLLSGLFLREANRLVALLSAGL